MAPPSCGGVTAITASAIPVIMELTIAIRVHILSI